MNFGLRILNYFGFRLPEREPAILGITERGEILRERNDRLADWARFQVGKMPTPPRGMSNHASGSYHYKGMALDLHPTDSHQLDSLAYMMYGFGAVKKTWEDPREWTNWGAIEWLSFDPNESHVNGAKPTLVFFDEISELATLDEVFPRD